ncbi:MAG TPA: PAS domain S-box protein, partial [Roseiflexaceae bacterium]
MSTSYDHMSRAELVAALETLQNALRVAVPGDRTARSVDETEHLLHELHVHQIELEMQNRELRDAQQALEESRDRYAELYDFAPVGYVTLDHVNCIADINLTGAALLGVERTGLIGQPFSLYVIKHDLPALLQHLARCRQTDATLVSEIDLRARDGDSIRVQMSSANRPGHAGGAARCAVTLTDISARARAERALQDSEARYRAISGLMSDLVFALRVAESGALEYEWHAGGLATATGYTIAELVEPSTWWRLVAPEDRPDAQRVLAALLDGQSQVIELRVTMTNEVAHWLRLHAQPERDAASGRVARIVGAINDISAYKWAGEAVRFHARLLDAVTQIVVATDPEGRITYWNRAAEQAHGWSAAEIARRPIGDQIVAAAARARFEEILSQARGGRPWFGELEARRRDGGTFPSLLTCSPIAQGAAVAGLVFVASDLTERKAFDRKLLETQKLESLGVLASGIAHDFNNLLAIILGNAELALSELPADAPARASLVQIDSAGRRAADLTRQMLAYAGKGRFVVQPIDLNDLVRDNMALLAAAVGKTARLRYRLAAELPAILADETQMRQIIMNLAINASEAIGEQDGTITFTTGARPTTAAELARYRFGAECTPGEYICLDVADTGSGMDAVMLERIFDPFFTTKFTGRGLGLAAVLGIVQGHHGALRVDSAPGQGTRFTILLPASVAPIERPENVSTPARSWHRSGAILVVDDE